MDANELGNLLLDVLPPDGTAMGNRSAWEALGRVAGLEAMVRGDVVEAMVALPGQLFLNTPIPVCLWFLANDKTRRGRDRRGETLFIDARQLGTMATRVQRVLTDEDIATIAGAVHAWRGDFVLTPASSKPRGRSWMPPLPPTWTGWALAGLEGSTPRPL